MIKKIREDVSQTCDEKMSVCFSSFQSFSTNFPCSKFNRGIDMSPLRVNRDKMVRGRFPCEFNPFLPKISRMKLAIDEIMKEAHPKYNKNAIK
jgi:hypothetical protein